jgi:hypothetical protein
MGAPATMFEKGERSQTTQIEQARVIAEVQGAIVVAQNRPRDINAALAEMRKVCTIEMMADRAFFAYDKGGNTATGGSIHLARELARIWGNITYGIKELSRRDNRPGEPYGESEMLAYAWDLQTNARPETTFIVPHYMDTRSGKKILKDARSIYENNANMGARRLREQIFAVIPRWFRDEAEDICRRTLEHGDGKPIKERIATAVQVAKTWGVTPEMIEKKYGCAITALSSVQIADLRIVFRSMKNGEITRDEAFPETPAADLDAHLRAKAATAEAKPQAAAVAPAAPGAPPGSEGNTEQRRDDAPHALAATVQVLIRKLNTAGMLKTLEEVITKNGEDIDLLRTEYPPGYDQVMAAIEARRAHFRR